MEPEPKQILTNAWPFIAIVLMSSGILVSTVPLESKRPTDPNRVKFYHAGRQDVEARLWQDPFVVMQNVTPRGLMARCEEAINDWTHHPSALGQAIAYQTSRNPEGWVTVLSVMVQVGPYFEDGEGVAGHGMQWSQPCSTRAGSHRMKISSGTYRHSRAASCNPGNVERRSCYPTNGTFAGASHKGHPEHSWSSGSTKTRWRSRWQGLKGSSNTSSQKTVYVCLLTRGTMQSYERSSQRCVRSQRRASITASVIFGHSA